MAKSILTVDDRHSTFNDVDLLLVMRMVLSSLREQGGDELVSIEEEWQRALDTHATGVIDLPLQKYANDEYVGMSLISHLSDLESSLIAYGDEVPLSHLKKHCKIPGVVFEGPYPTCHVVAAVRSLRGLIQAASGKGTTSVPGLEKLGS